MFQSFGGTYSDDMVYAVSFGMIAMVSVEKSSWVQCWTNSLATIFLLAFLTDMSVATAPAERVTVIDADDLSALLDERKGQLVLVNFWATWCRPCLKEIPVLMYLAEEYASRGFSLVPVSLDDPDQFSSVLLPFLDEFFPDFQTYASSDRDMDTTVSVIDPAWNQVLPTSYLLDRQGRVVAKIQGGRTRAQFVKKILPSLDADDASQ